MRVTEDALSLAAASLSAATKRGGLDPSGAPLESVLSIEFETAALPNRAASAAKLVECLHSSLAVRLRRELVEEAAKMADFKTLSIAEFDVRVPLRIVFEGGLLATADPHRSVNIRSLEYDVRGDILEATVFGTNEEAELVIARAYECLWESAGRPQAWKPQGLAGVHSRTIYTRTHEDLGLEFGQLFGAPIRAFLEEITTQGGVANEMGPRPIDRRTGEVEAKDPRVVVRLGELTLRFQVLDLRAGRLWSCPLSIHPKTKGVAGAGIYNVVTELPLEQHRRLVDALRRHLEQT